MGFNSGFKGLNVAMYVVRCVLVNKVLWQTVVSARGFRNPRYLALRWSMRYLWISLTWHCDVTMTKCGDTTVVEQADTPARFTGQWPKNVVKWSTNWTTRQRTEKSNNQLDNYVPLCTIMYHYVPLCTIMYHCAPLCTIMYHYVTLWTTMYHYVPLCTIMYHYVPLCTTV